MTDSVTQRITRYFQEHPGDIACVYLFGSRARQQAKATSDVDIAVLYRGDSPGGFASLGIPLAGALEKIVATPVDVIVMNNANVDLIHRILRDGVILYEVDRAARITFEVNARNRYFDLKPYLDAYRRTG